MAAAERNRALLAWYDQTADPSPGADSDPWAILVSEVMSQQTQISRVVPRWEAFMARYPEPASLAEADRSELIRLWKGLGYQRRAINLQRAAAMVAARVADDEHRARQTPGRRPLHGGCGRLLRVR